MDSTTTEPWQEVMAHHAKSFHLASLFFPGALFRKVKALYALCRWIDDAADEAPDRETSQKELDRIMFDLRSSHPSLAPNRLYRECGLNPVYVEDLMEGALDDLSQVRIQDLDALIQYCYKVAGTVGLAMNDLMAVPNAPARAFAVDLGIAMQLTNICRDIKEDALNDRIYIPKTLLDAHGIDSDQLLALTAPEQPIAQVTTALLDLADVYYKSAQTAFPYIPFRVRGPIIIASRLYKGIGDKLRKRGANPLRGRVFLSPIEKGITVGAGLWAWFTSGLGKKPLQHKKQLHKGLQRWKTIREFPS